MENALENQNIEDLEPQENDEEIQNQRFKNMRKIHVNLIGAKELENNIHMDNGEDN